MPTKHQAVFVNQSGTGDTPAGIKTPVFRLKAGSDRVVALNFRVSADFKKAFKIAAATQGVTQSDLLQQAFDEWTERHG